MRKKSKSVSPLRTSKPTTSGKQTAPNKHSDKMGNKEPKHDKIGSNKASAKDKLRPEGGKPSKPSTASANFQDLIKMAAQNSAGTREKERDRERPGHRTGDRTGEKGRHLMESKSRLTPSSAPSSRDHSPLGKSLLDRTSQRTKGSLKVHGGAEVKGHEPKQGAPAEEKVREGGRQERKNGGHDHRGGQSRNREQSGVNSGGGRMKPDSTKLVRRPLRISKSPLPPSRKGEYQVHGEYTTWDLGCDVQQKSPN